MKVRFKWIGTCARCPQKSTVGSACYDLFAAINVVLEPGSTRSVETDIGFCFSNTYVAKIYPRSSVSLKPVQVGGGFIDCDFSGNVTVTLHHISANRR